MAGERYRHIFLGGPTHTQRYTSPRKGGSQLRVKAQDRAGHSERLQRRLAETWKEVEQRQAVLDVERDGAYIEFVSEPGFELAIQSLEALRSGIRLQNVRTEGEGESKRTLATVYVPLKKRRHFLKKIQEYATENTKKGDKPKNATLINSISDIRLAVLKSFWRPDERSRMPGDDCDWVEVWLSSDDKAVVKRFEELLQRLDVESTENLLKFPERSVKMIRANRNQLERIIEQSDDIAEYRLAKELATFYVEMDNREQVERVRELLSRCSFDDDTDVAVCILDTGVNNGHLLLQPVLDSDDLHTVRPEWGVDDHDEHGTLMAGTAAYGDLLSLLESNGPVRIAHRLESAKILPPGNQKNAKELWGDFTSQGISRAEIQASHRKRIVCMAITAAETRERGRPSSWSAAVDELASGYLDDTQRLIVISAGNVDNPECWRNYPEDNKTNDVHDPAQAWNALTVGAFTEKTRITDPTLASYTPVAPNGGLSPYSTTSLDWPLQKWPIKPDVVFEGGNAARGPDGFVTEAEDLALVSTYRRPQERQFDYFCATSAACAQAAWMAAQIQVQYPEAWPETIRALIVHSADWTEALKRQFLQDGSKGSYAKLLRICGYGVPSMERALYCLSNSLTLISQTTMRPFDKKDSRYVTRDMHLYNLPWPRDVLLELGEAKVTMRMTLSYFVEPGPGEVGWNNRYTYASHALRFKVNGPGESKDDFVRRVNQQARDGGESLDSKGAMQGWRIGDNARHLGSVHSDIWDGRAADLAGSNLIAVYPAAGWWRERHHLGRWNRTCRYALIVSIHAPEQAVDIYTPVATQIGLTIPAEITIR